MISYHTPIATSTSDYRARIFKHALGNWELGETTVSKAGFRTDPDAFLVLSAGRSAGCYTATRTAIAAALLAPRTSVINSTPVWRTWQTENNRQQVVDGTGARFVGNTVRMWSFARRLLADDLWLVARPALAAGWSTDGATVTTAAGVAASLSSWTGLVALAGVHFLFVSHGAAISSPVNDRALAESRGRARFTNSRARQTPTTAFLAHLL